VWGGSADGHVWEGGTISVHYHADWCTKNKRMFRIPTLGFFNLHRESSFFFTK
jgi:hypothetical protein